MHTIKIAIMFWAIIFCIQANAQKYNLVWADEFNGSGVPDPDKWGYELGYQRNKELQYYTNRTSNVRQYNGNLEITIRKENIGGFNYTSGSVTTEGKADWTYGKIEGRILMPIGQGLWSCFWTLGTNFHNKVGWPACGEIDILEHINTENIIHGTLHWENNGHVQNGSIDNVDVTKWHTYSIVWDTSNITWYVDDIKYHQVSILNGVNSTQEFHKSHYILLNFPIGGSWPGNPNNETVIPATMYIDYVRVYQLDSLVGSVGKVVQEKKECFISIHPNPLVNSNLVISVPGGPLENTRINVLDLTGKVIKSIFFNALNNGQNLDLSDYGAGMYFIEFQTPATRVVKSFIKK